jgi:alpha-ketoglutarate-dependent taurine dioxygenase
MTDQLKNYNTIKGRRKQINSDPQVVEKIITEKSQSYALYESNSNGLVLGDWIVENLDHVEHALDKYGAALFRGYAAQDHISFSDFSEKVCKKIMLDNGEHTRSSVNNKVYTPVSYPNEKKILWHNENSYNLQWPQRILFCCLQPAERGGNTPIVDSRQVLKFLDKSIVDEFRSKNVMYIRTYDGQLGNSWQHVFQTNNKTLVEQRCIEQQITFRWLNGDRLQTRAVRPAVIPHPRTGELSWFNQAQHWHLRCLEKEVRDALLQICAKDELPRECLYGDGTIISDSVIDEICKAYQALEISFPWQPNDVLLLDNIAMAHARNPYSGVRRLLVAMGDMLSYQDTNTGIGN